MTAAWEAIIEDRFVAVYAGSSIADVGEIERG